MPKRPCLTCGRLADGTRCEPCRLARGRALDRERDRTRQRPSARQRGYDAQHERNRKRVLAASDVCWLCGHAGADQADDVLPKSRGGTGALVNLRPAHGSKPCPTCGIRCNQVRGNREAVTLRSSDAGAADDRHRPS